MARKVDYAKRGQKIKAALDEFIQDVLADNNEVEDAVETPKKVKVIDIDFDGEDTQTLLKLQSRLTRIISRRLKE